MFLQSTTQGARPVGTICASLADDPLFCVIGEAHDESMIRHCAIDLINLKLQYVEQFLIAQFIEHDDLVKAIDKFRIERLAHGGHHHFFHLRARDFGRSLESHRASLLNKTRADV